MTLLDAQGNRLVGVADIDGTPTEVTLPASLAEPPSLETFQSAVRALFERELADVRAENARLSQELASLHKSLKFWRNSVSELEGKLFKARRRIQELEANG